MYVLAIQTRCFPTECGCRLWFRQGRKARKLAFPHCMLRVTNTVNNMPLLRYPDVCPRLAMPSALSTVLL